MLESYEATGFINERGGLEMNDRDGMLKAMRGFARNVAVLVSVKVLREKRSSAQNRFWHGVVIPAFAEHCGYEFEEMKDALALKLIPKELVDMSTGEICIVPGHTSALNTREFNDLIERAQRLGAEMDIYIPDPGEDVTGAKRGHQTHYTAADSTPDRRGNNRAVCGERVNEKAGDTSTEPTCPKCQQWLSAREAEPLPSWAQEAR